MYPIWLVFLTLSSQTLGYYFPNGVPGKEDEKRQLVPEPRHPDAPPMRPEPRDTLLQMSPPDLVPEPRQTASGCDSTFAFPSGGMSAALRSPNYPSPYPNNAAINYCFSSPEGTLLSLSCSEVDIESPSYFGTCYDYLGVSLGGRSDYSDMQRVCGKGTLPSTLSTSNKLNLQFRSDGSNPFSLSTRYRFSCTVSVSGSASVTTAAPTTRAPVTSTAAPTSSAPVTSTGAPTSSAPVTSTATPTSSAPVTSTAAPTSSAPVTSTATPTSSAPVTSTAAPTTKAPSTTAPSSNSTCQCGLKNNGARIVGGAAATANEYPWRCYLKTDSYSFFCGCSIINENWILTAAHCTSAVKDQIRSGSERLYAVVGDHYRSQSNVAPAKTVRISSFTEHPAYNNETQDNDMALLKLETPLTFNRYISPVCLPWGMEAKNFQGTTVSASGWGTTSSGGSTSDVLREVDLSVLTTEQCATYYPGMITNNMLCTYNPGKDTCQGDSGGSIDFLDSATQTYKAIGVVSWGIGCAGQNQPGVYAKVTNYLSWIQSTTNANFCKN